MALTDAQKADIRLYVGWSARFHQVDTRLESAMTALDALPEHEAQVLAMITDLKSIDADLVAARRRLKAGEVGTIKLNASEIASRRSEGRQIVARLCSVMGIERGNDVYSSAPVHGFADFDRPMGGGGGGSYIGK